VHCHALHPVACAAGPAQLLWQITHTHAYRVLTVKDTMQALPLRVLQAQHNSCGKSHTQSICRQGRRRTQCKHYHCVCCRPSTTPVANHTHTHTAFVGRRGHNASTTTACAAVPAQFLWQITHTHKEHLSAGEGTMHALPLHVLQAQHNSRAGRHMHACEYVLLYRCCYAHNKVTYHKSQQHNCTTASLHSR